MFEFDEILHPLVRVAEEYPLSELEELGLPRCCLPHLSSYRELVYEPAIDYEQAKLCYLDKTLLSRWEKVPVKAGARVILLTWVIPSGLGDLAMQLYAAEAICERLPDIELSLISIVEEGTTAWKEQDLPYKHEILYYCHPKLPELSKELKQEIANASLILQMPTYFPHSNEILRVHGPRHALIGEYGFIDSKEFHPRLGARSMGLHPFEMGIFTLTPKKAPGKNPNRFFAYLITERGSSVYLHALFSFTDALSTDIYLYTPSLERLRSSLEKESFFVYGIRSIILLDGNQRSEISINTEGKRVFIQKITDLSHKAIRELMASSHPFIACRGDGSFTEALSVDATFFYDFLPHAKPFLGDLLAIAQKELPAYPTLEAYLKTMLLEDSKTHREIGRELAEHLLDPSLRAGMIKLKEFIYERFTCIPSLIHLIKQEISYHQSPDLEKKQKALIQDWIAKKTPLSELLKTPQ